MNTAYLSPFTWTGGTVHLTSSTQIAPGPTRADQPFADSLTLTAAKTLIVDDTLLVPVGGELNITGGTVLADTITTGGDIHFTSGTMRMRDNQDFSAARLAALDLQTPLAASRSLVVDGTATINAPMVLAGGTFSAGQLVNPQNLILSSGTLNVNSSDLQIAAATTVDVTTGMTIHATAGGLDNAGTLNIIGSQASFSAASTNQAGAEINAIHADLTFTGGLTNNGDLNLIDTNIAGSVTSNASSSTLVGSNSVSGDYSMGPGDALFIDLGGTLPGEFDTLTIGGDGTLAGNLHVALDPDFTLTVGDSFDIVEIGGSASGTFAGLADGALVDNFGSGELFISYSGGDGNNVTLLTTSGFVTGDMDCDGDVDFDDIDDFVLGLTDPEEYENQNGLPPETKGDTDGDGDIDFDDIDDFVTILSGSNSVGTQQVPEPGTAILLCLGVVVLAFRGWLKTVRR